MGVTWRPMAVYEYGQSVTHGPGCWPKGPWNLSTQDHHYHFGYFVVTAAILAKLKPEWKNNTDFVDFVTSSADGHRMS